MTTDYEQMFIGGEWIRPSSAAVINVTSASTGEVIGTVAQAQEADVDAAVAARPPGVRRPLRLVPVGASPPGRGNGEPGRSAGKPRRGDGPPGQLAERHADLHRDPTGSRFPGPAVALLRRPGEGLGVRRGTPAHARRYDDRTARTDRRGRRHRALELPADAGRLQTRPGDGRRLHRRSQTVARDRTRRHALRRSGRRVRHPGRCHQHRAWWTRGRGVSGPTPRHRQGGLHRLHRRWPADRRDLRPAAAAGHPWSWAASPPRSSWTTPSWISPRSATTCSRRHL